MRGRLLSRIWRVTHRDDADDLIRKGKDLEQMVLAQAVRLHMQRRVLAYRNRTVVFAGTGLESRDKGKARWSIALRF